MNFKKPYYCGLLAAHMIGELTHKLLPHDLLPRSQNHPKIIFASAHEVKRWSELSAIAVLGFSVAASLCTYSQTPLKAYPTLEITPL